VVNGGCAFRIEQGGFGGDVYGGAEGSDVEPDYVLGRKGGMDLDDAIEEGKGFATNLKMVKAERETAGG
jgi:hypothetical protein